MTSGAFFRRSTRRKLCAPRTYLRRDARERSRTDGAPSRYVAAFVAELSLCLWLLAKGVNVERWRSQARNSAAHNGG